jgi:hypothetical protein
MTVVFCIIGVLVPMFIYLSEFGDQSLKNFAFHCMLHIKRNKHEIPINDMNAEIFRAQYTVLTYSTFLGVQILNG